MNELCLSVSNVTKIYNKDLFRKSTKAVDDLSFSVLRGKCTGFLGHNGAGKTTTIKMILGLTNTSQGKILFNNKTIDKNSKAIMGYMAETNKLPAHLTCYEALKYHCMLYGLEDENKLIEQKLGEVHLLEHKNKRLKDLSKGMGRRISWAMATIHNPKFLILDEPFSGLDPKGRILIEALILEQKRKGVSILLCTHEINAVDRICDDFFIINSGKLVFSSRSNVADNANTCSVEVSANVTWMNKYKNDNSLASWQKVEEIEKNHFKFVFTSSELAKSWLNSLSRNNELDRLISFNDQSDQLKNILLQYFN